MANPVIPHSQSPGDLLLSFVHSFTYLYSSIHSLTGIHPFIHLHAFIHSVFLSLHSSNHTHSLTSLFTLPDPGFSLMMIDMKQQNLDVRSLLMRASDKIDALSTKVAYLLTIYQLIQRTFLI